MSDRAPTTTPSTSALDTFRLDVEYTRLSPAFTAAGLRAILLKGPAFDQLLFGGRRSRTYSDIDLLVDPACVPAAHRLLDQIGFRTAEQEPTVRRLLRRTAITIGALGAAHATPWIRDRDGFTIDLHHTLPLLGAPAAVAWRELDVHRIAITIVDSQVETLDPPASALLIALHAAHHGPAWSRARTDLERACEVLERGSWDGAARLARDLRSQTAMGIGLGTTAVGRGLARELGLRSRPTHADRLRWSVVARRERDRAGD
jgi:hypothetical protein